MIKIKKICPKCNKEIGIIQLDFQNKEVQEVDLDEIIGLGIDCEHCGTHINFEEQWEDEE